MLKCLIKIFASQLWYIIIVEIYNSKKGLLLFIIILDLVFVTHEMSSHHNKANYVLLSNTEYKTS